MLAYNQKVLVARSNEIYFAGDCRGEHGDIIGITAEIGIKRRRFHQLCASFVNT